MLVGKLLMLFVVNPLVCWFKAVFNWEFGDETDWIIAGELDSILFECFKVLPLLDEIIECRAQWFTSLPLIWRFKCWISRVELTLSFPKWVRQKTTNILSSIDANNCSLIEQSRQFRRYPVYQKRLKGRTNQYLMRFCDWWCSIVLLTVYSSVSKWMNKFRKLRHHHFSNTLISFFLFLLSALVFLFHSR